MDDKKWEWASENPTEYVREAILNDGTIVGYDCCSQEKATSPNLTFIGQGKIYRLNGVRQMDTKTIYNFYNRK